MATVAGTQDSGRRAKRREREDLEQALDGLGREEEGLAQAVVASGSEGEAAADRFEAVDAQLWTRTSFCWAWASLPLEVALITSFDELGDVEKPDDLGWLESVLAWVLTNDSVAASELSRPSRWAVRSLMTLDVAAR